ncbi:peptide/nickel transport system permease protein [Microbacterium resistens]|uniref:Peptide/nickel transport system permease protein n=1 Tax=Microbacterium resistens TaxID=156977 RepID=A0ABU1SFJ6_9MICO|nr:ABC transporter permease [Microbacterium resistens]MDR6868374.1 peptide/nickel transport system permease protein [Microbacterium resistens]
MLMFAARRLAQLVPMLLIVTAVIFALINTAGYDVVDAITTPSMSEATKEAMRAKFGLDQPLWVQYGLWLGNVVQGDFGYSLVSRHSIAADLATRIPNTIALIGPAYLTAFILAIVLGLAAGSRPGSRLDRIIDGVCSVAIATPTFWFALLVIFVFGFQLRAFPILGMHSVGRTDYADYLAHFAMPFLVLVVALFPNLTRYVRAAAATQQAEDYVLVQRAFGAGRWTILSRHVSRNVLLPVITQVGLAVPILVTGAIVTESIFGWPGVGEYLLTASSSLDYPVILTVLLLSAVLVVLGNLLADLLYVAADPRIRLGRRAR